MALRMRTAQSNLRSLQRSSFHALPSVLCTPVKQTVSLEAVRTCTKPGLAAVVPARLWSTATTTWSPEHTKRRLCRLAAASPEIEAAKPEDDRIPVTVITGFLGAGKTTLLNNILTQNHGRRIAVIENEFGEIDIDSELVAKQEVLEGSRDVVTQLSNGCLCCTVRDDLIQALNRLYDRRSDFDHIVIETTGLANPAPIISSFYMDQSLPDKVRLDGVVTVVDAKHVSKHLDTKKEENVVNEAVEQIAYADRILLNKTDLVDPGVLASLEARVRAINKMAEIKRTQRSQVEVDYVLGVGGFELENVEKELNTTLKRDGQLKEHDHHHHHHHDHDHDCQGAGCSHESHAHAHSHDHDHGHDCGGPDCKHESHSHDHSHASHSHDHDHDCAGSGCTHESHNHTHQVHDDKVSSVSLLIEGDMDLDKINFSLGHLLEMRSEDIYRMKGLLSIHGSEYRYVYQGVHTIFEGVPDRKWREDEQRMCKMVFIGRELDKEAFKEAFEYCVVKNKSQEEAASEGTESPAPAAACVLRGREFSVDTACGLDEGVRSGGSLSTAWSGTR